MQLEAMETAVAKTTVALAGYGGLVSSSSSSSSYLGECIPNKRCNNRWSSLPCGKRKLAQQKNATLVCSSNAQSGYPTSVSPVRAVATEEGHSTSSTSLEKGKTTKYYYVVANAKFMLDEEEHFQELMRERLRNYGERNKEQDFWLVIEPKFLEKFPHVTKRLGRPAVALVSTNGTWITFMKLRLDRVLEGAYEAETLEEALASSPVDLQFEKPGIWTAPYPKYEYGWWKPFLPPQ